MEILYNYLPKDLVNIIEEYAKDRTQYNIVLRHFKKMIGKQSTAWYTIYDDYIISKSLLKLIHCQNRSIKWNPYSHRRWLRKNNILRYYNL